MTFQMHEGPILQPPGAEYVRRQFDLLLQGTRRLPLGLKERTRAFIVGAQDARGGFAGRRGAPELYYTGFALRAADLLEIEGEAFWRKPAGFLAERASGAKGLVDVFSLLSSLAILSRRGVDIWPAGDVMRRGDEMLGLLKRFRLPEGGYRKESSAGASLYHTFLAAICHSLLLRTLPDADGLPELVRGRQAPDGGFSDLPGEPEATNPTAAAVSLLKTIGSLDERTASSASRSLAPLQRGDGGFAAHAHAPGSDLMSTFTALVALSDCGALSRVRLAGAARFVKSVLASSGGFFAEPGDSEVDVEYTYYGLGTLALLAGAAPR
jgi:geranylgeranyl transferase type-2 subunit beta